MSTQSNDLFAPTAVTPDDAPENQLRRLELRRFGKFQDRSFDLGPSLTIFHGKNEAGKTTLFDALSEALCRPKGSHRMGKAIRERYGDEYEVGLIDEHGEDLRAGKNGAVFSEDEFQNLYAVRAGENEIRLDAGGKWVERLKARLFSADVDPAVIAKNLGEIVSEDKRRSHQKGLIAAQKEYDDLSAQLDQKRSEYDGIVAREQNIERLNAALAENQQKITALQERLSTGEQELVREDRIRERAGWARRWKDLVDLQKAEQRARDLSRYRTDEHADLDRIEQSIADVRTQAGSVQAGLEHKNGDLERLRKDLSALEELSPALKARSETAALCLDRIQQNVHNRYSRQVVRWNKWMLGAATLLTAIGAGLGFTLSGEVAYIGIGVALVAASALVSFARSKELVTDDGPHRELLATLQDEWRSRFDEDLSATNSLDALREELVRRRHRYESEHLREMDRLAAEIRSLEENVRTLEQQRDDLGRRMTELEEQRNAWLREHDVRDRDEYLERCRAFAAARSSATELEQRVLRELNKLHASARDGEAPASGDPESLREECERRLRDFDREGVPESGRSDAEYRRLKNETEAARSDLAALQQENRSLAERRAGDAGELRGATARLSREIGELEQRLLYVEQDIAKKKLDRKAAGLALEIFETLQQDNHLMLEELARDLQGSVANILPERDVRFAEPSLNMQTFSMQDAGGTERPVAQLSRSTADSFLFAARAALARRSHDDGRPGILVFDEPFASFDDERDVRCLEFLRKFQNETGWQIILFTKDRRFFEEARTMFHDAVAHELEAAR